MQTFRQRIAEYPCFLRAKDLVELGLFHSVPAVCVALKKGEAPPGIRIGSRILYEKEELLEWLKKKKT